MPPAHTYTQIDDYVINQLMSKELVNTVKESARYIGEDVFNSLHGDTNIVRRFRMDNGATHGGAIYFFPSYRYFLKADSAGSELLCRGLMTVGKNSTQVVRGDRQVLAFIGTKNSGADYYLGSEASYYLGWKAPGAGSILSYAAFGYNVNSDTYTAQVEIHKNGASVWNGAGMSFSGVNMTRQDYGTQARGTDTFAAGDFIDVFLNFTAGGNTTWITCMVEVILDE